MNHFNKFAGVKVIEELTADHIYLWLSSMNVSNQTKLTRLKCLKTFSAVVLIMLGLKLIFEQSQNKSR